MSDGYSSPEEAARGDIPERFSPALAVSRSPDGKRAIVLLGTNGPPDYYPYQEEVRRQRRGWVAEGGSNMCIGGTLWDEAPPTARVAIVRWEGDEYEVPVANGYFHFSPWDSARSWPATPS